MKDSHDQRALGLFVRPGRQILFLYCVAIVLSIASLGGQVLYYGLGFDDRLMAIFVRLTDVDDEANIPTWFQSTVLMFNALSLWVTAGRARAEGSRWWPHWGLLALAFGFLSLDEFAGLHEKTVPIIRGTLQYDWVPEYAWVVLAIPLVILFGLVYARFLLAMPGRTRWGLIISGAIYLSGTVGMELVGSWVASNISDETLLYSLVAGIEEFLEMIGSITLLWVVAAHALRPGTPER